MITDLTIWAASDSYVEADCAGCGARHVIDPRQVRALINAVAFDCYWCGATTPTPDMGGYTVADNIVHGICPTCMTLPEDD